MKKPDEKKIFTSIKDFQEHYFPQQTILEEIKSKNIDLFAARIANAKVRKLIKNSLENR